jgi:hypothetical protein
MDWVLSSARSLQSLVLTGCLQLTNAHAHLLLTNCDRVQLLDVAGCKLLDAPMVQALHKHCGRLAAARAKRERESKTVNISVTTASAASSSSSSAPVSIPAVATSTPQRDHKSPVIQPSSFSPSAFSWTSNLHQIEQSQRQSPQLSATASPAWPTPASSGITAGSSAAASATARSLDFESSTEK